MSGHSIVNSDVLQAWCDAPSHLLPPELPQTPTQLSAESSPQRHRFSPAEISQQSVDLLLREYYAMVTAQRHNNNQHHHEGSGSVLQSTFLLLLCPAPPSCLELDQVLKAAIWVVQLVAKAVVYASVLLVPLWLGLTRQALLDQGPAAAAAVVAGGLMLFLLSDSIHKSCARQATCVTAATLQQQLQTAAFSSNELATLRAASKTATTSNTHSRPGSMSHHQAPHAAAKPQAAAISGGGGSIANKTGSTAPTSYAALQQDLAAVQAALGVPTSSSHPAGSREQLQEALLQVSQQLGMQVTPDMTASPAAMVQLLTAIKQSVGI